MTVPIRPIASTAPPVSVWMACTRRVISSVACAVSRASCLTSSATTANPRPASPARAASIVALSASRFVWPAMAEISLTTSPISSDDAPSRPIVALVSAASSTAPAATRAASPAFCAICRIEVLICCAPAATVATDRDTSPAAVVAAPDWPEVCSAETEIWAEDRARPAAAPATASAERTTALIRSRSEVWAVCSARPIWPISSLPRTLNSTVRSPSARACRPSLSRPTGRTTDR